MKNLQTLGYVKMIAIKVDDFESEIIDEKNTNSHQEYEGFRNKYRNIPTVQCIYLHMDDNYVKLKNTY